MAALAALVPPEQPLGVEALSFQSVTGIPSRLGIEVVPLPMDEQGLRGDAIARAHRRRPRRAIYLQPTLHNPLGITMPPSRRAEVVQGLRTLDLIAIGDHVYASLIDDPSPLALVPAIAEAALAGAVLPRGLRSKSASAGSPTAP